MKLFITGASSGLGEALAREFHRRAPALTVGLLARRQPELERLAATLAGARTASYAVDVMDRGALDAAAKDFMARFGAPDVVIANAGISAGTLTGEADDAVVFERIMRVNVIGMYDTFAPFVEPMASAGGGVLAGVASVAGVRGLPGSAGYSASKAANIAYLESLRLEMRARKIGVVTIAPGFIRTPMTARNHYRMPFLMDAAPFAERAVDAVLARKSFVVIPWQMGLVSRVMRLMPNAVYDALFARMPRKARIDAQAADHGDRG